MIYIDFERSDWPRKHYLAIDELKDFGEHKCWAITGCEENYGIIVKLNGKYVASYNDGYHGLPEDTCLPQYLDTVENEDFLDAVRRLFTLGYRLANSPTLPKIKFYDPYKVLPPYESYWAVDLIPESSRILTTLPN